MKNFGLLPFSSSFSFSFLYYIPTIFFFLLPVPSLSCIHPAILTLPILHPLLLLSFSLSSSFLLFYLFLSLSFKKTANSQPANSLISLLTIFFSSFDSDTCTFLHNTHHTPHNTQHTTHIGPVQY